MKSIRIPLLILLLAACAASLAADERGDAKSVADGFLASFDSKDYRNSYRRQVSRSLRDRVEEEAFVAQTSILGNQLGGSGSNRRLIDETRFHQMPMPDGSTLSGTFYSFRYRAQYPAGAVYQDVSTELEGNGSWKIVGFYFYPAPD